ncbi:MAG: hypothetical protein LBJ31_09860 [Treponema sp.]|nr:hypothetical protein [Treponema sp.]
MFNFKAAGIAAVFAAALSLILGVLNGIGPFVIVCRMLLFGGLFFGLACLVIWLAGQFLPELLVRGEDDLDIPAPGSYVDLTVGPATGAFPSGSGEEVDDIAANRGFAGSPGEPPPESGPDLGMDPDADLQYNEGGVFAGTDEGEGESKQSDALPDMDVMTEAFTQAGKDAAAAVEAIAFESDGPRQPLSTSSRNKADMAGDFNPKELAQAIQTVLKKDEKG